MKVRIEHVDEAFSSAGYVSHQFDDISGFSYNILPLQFNLQQKGNTKPNDKGVFKYYVGDFVTGICEYDDNQHNGIIKHLYYDPETAKVKLVYIQDMETQQIVPLKANTVKKYKQKNNRPRVADYFFTHQTDITRS